ncbi:MAG: hypothetical protein ABFS46_06270 [Myxococcota bacterium]
MNWEAIGAIAEAVGAAGVIASLVYLGVQIRSNTRAAKVAAYQQTVTSSRDFNLALLANSELFEAMIRRWGLTDQEEIDKTREGLFFEAAMQNWESQLYQHEQGMLDDGMWEVRRARIRNTVVRNRNFSDWWSKANRTQFTPRLQELIDELVASITRAA